MIDQVARYWWLIVLRGILGILFGIAAFALPGITLVVLVMFFGAYMFVDGVLALISAIRFRHERERWVMLLIEGILGIAVGALTFFYPGITALAWVYIIAGWAIVTGVLEIVAAAKLRGSLGTEVLLIVSGIVSLLLGLAFAVLPLIGMFVAVLMIGAYAIAFGVLLVVSGIRLRTLGASSPGQTAVGGMT